MIRPPKRPLPGCSVSHAVTGSSYGEHPSGIFIQEEHREHVNKISGHKFIPGGPGIPCIPGKPFRKRGFQLGNEVSNVNISELLAQSILYLSAHYKLARCESKVKLDNL